MPANFSILQKKCQCFVLQNTCNIKILNLKFVILVYYFHSFGFFWIDISSYQEALAYLRSKRPCVHPNDGFMHQLLLYERMGFKLDPNFKPYKLYRLVCIHNNVKQTKILPPKNLLFQTETNSNLRQSETKLGSIPIIFLNLFVLFGIQFICKQVSMNKLRFTSLRKYLLNWSQQSLRQRQYTDAKNVERFQEVLETFYLIRRNNIPLGFRCSIGTVDAPSNVDKEFSWNPSRQPCRKFVRSGFDFNFS